MFRLLLFMLCFAAVCRPLSAAAEAPQRPEPTIEAPRFQNGGMIAFNRWVLERMEFPDNLYDEGDQAEVTVSFMITRKGELKRAMLKNTTDRGYSDQILQLLPTAPAWTPAMLDGKPVDQECTSEMNLVLRKDADGRLVAEDQSLYTHAQTMPRFEDGGPKKFVEWVRSQVDTPLDARVFVRFVIEKDGSMSDVDVRCAKDKTLAQRVTEVLTSAPRWTPASEQGAPVRFKASVPVDFGKSIGASDEEIPFVMAETMPKFRGGTLMDFREWVIRTLKYPQDALRHNITGRVVLSFVVERDGTVTNIKVNQSPSDLLSEAAVSAVAASPKWTPGKQAGRVVRVKYTLPVDFRTTVSR